ncbi:family 1 glycosylhydrolase [Geobacter sp. DSM 9736]|uniref:family 1 glycosylhydrolase n=1 Tax=Geobacter sp. DSM 9736 TaxID=1277350 RepID=UPI000B5F5304|nr:family 1 glycosylhydrolase [Geobacter sp. DSM 9736]SNB47505.1 dTDP-4-dehydrorhamnose reductase [Geobacter sp. DSM 9736]
MEITDMSKARSLPEIWGGIECTINRVGDKYFRQLERNGHLTRPEDLMMFAELGLKTLRYPVLWEQVAPDGLDHPDWSWPDERLHMLRDLGITPVLTLLHHGSGPRYTSLTDPQFPEKLARYAGMVAERYPWLEWFTPVNEPLTTGRFSGLYGIWFPHGRDNLTFVRCLLQQCRGTITAMEAIREVIPNARLVITEDMGRTFAIPLLQYQADFENMRRWLSLDLLFGRIDRDHPLRSWLLRYGALEKELEQYLESPVRPDVVGLNYYLTSDRVLDERMHLYPEDRHGGNGRHCYADVEAVRAWPEGILGHAEVLRSAWERYRTAVALTEVHLGGNREGQLRWFLEAWQAAVKLKNSGVEVRAVTAWSLLGAFDWNRLLREEKGFYEPGVYDVRGQAPRCTALGRMLRSLSKSGTFDHPVLTAPGWWRRDDRFFHEDCRSSVISPFAAKKESSRERPLLVVGRTGTLGQGFARICELRGLHHILLSRQDIDIASSAAVNYALETYRPWAVVNAAGYVRVDEAEEDFQACFRENTLGPMTLAAACREQGVALLSFSSDLVFDGGKGSAYLESDPIAPLNVYGKSKADAERHVLSLFPEALMIRTSAFFGPWDKYNFVTMSLARLARGDHVRAAADMVVSPTYVPDLIHTCLDLLMDQESGIWHVSNDGNVNWAELAASCARMANIDEKGVIRCTAAELGFQAKRPVHSVLKSERGIVLPPLDDALQRYFAECSVPLV